MLSAFSISGEPWSQSNLPLDRDQEHTSPPTFKPNSPIMKEARAHQYCLKTHSIQGYFISHTKPSVLQADQQSKHSGHSTRTYWLKIGWHQYKVSGAEGTQRLNKTPPFMVISSAMTQGIMGSYAVPAFSSTHRLTALQTELITELDIKIVRST